MISIAQALKDATKAISDKQISDTPLLDATLLLMHVTNYRREQLYLHSQQPLSKEHFEQFNNLVNQRLDYEPIAYLTNKREFYKHTFKVTKDVLIPRSDSEINVPPNIPAKITVVPLLGTLRM
jgi:release factor glutamine methyltransferase